MTEGQISILIAAAGFICQAAGVIILFTIRTKILESEARQTEAVDRKLRDYALDEVCKLRHEQDFGNVRTMRTLTT
jgi:hypothetical protein